MTGAPAIVITAAGSRDTGGQTLTGPVDSLAKLAALLDWYITKRDGLNPLGGPGQVWVVGAAACAGLGWWTSDDTQLGSVLAGSLDELAATGWRLVGDVAKLGPQILISKTLSVPRRDEHTGPVQMRRERRLVQIVLEPFAPLITKRTEIGLLEELPADDEAAGQQVGRRVGWLVEHLGVLPTVTAAGTGQRIQDQIYKARKKSGKGAVVEVAGVIPELDIGGAGSDGAGVVGVGELEPAAHWGRPHIGGSELAADSELVLLDQTAAYLATCSSIELGFGPVRHVVGGQAVAGLLAAGTVPFGVYLVVLPAGARISVPVNLPLPHPLMAADRDVTAWITAESVRGLCKSVDDGGAGLGVEDLAIDEAWVWESSRRFLEDWAAVLRAARLAAMREGETVLEWYVKAIYKQYVGRMGSDKWPDSKMHHCQPIWRASIIANCRWRARRQAIQIYHAHPKKNLWPIYTYTDSWRYIVSPGMVLAPTKAQFRAREVAGEPLKLGQLVEEDRRPLSDHEKQLLLASTSGEELSAIVYGDSAVPVAPIQPACLPAPSAPTQTQSQAPAPVSAPVSEPVRGRRGKGRREREYVGDHLDEILADVSERAVADVKRLVEQGQFSYQPDGVHHMGPVPPPREVVPVQIPPSAAPVRIFALGGVNRYVVAAAVLLAIVVAVVIIAVAVW